jgi:hypothetical protein
MICKGGKFVRLTPLKVVFADFFFFHCLDCYCCCYVDPRQQEQAEKYNTEVQTSLSVLRKGNKACSFSSLIKKS